MTGSIEIKQHHKHSVQALLDAIMNGETITYQDIEKYIRQMVSVFKKPDWWEQAFRSIE